MCGELTLNIDVNQLELELGLPFINRTGKKEFKVEALAFSQNKPQIPILFQNEEDLVLEEAYWALTPDWSKEFPPKFATYNARLTRPKEIEGQQTLEFIYDVPAFKDSFRAGQFCLIPVNSCFEYSYFGEFAGNKVKYSLENRPFFILGLYNKWMGDGRGVLSTTMLTDAPSKFHYDIGHDRSTVVVDLKTWNEINQNKYSYKDVFQMIRKSKKMLSWKGEVVSPMKEGWQRRAPDMIDLIQIQSEVWE